MLDAKCVDSASFWNLDRLPLGNLALCLALQRTWKERASMRLILKMGLEVRVPVNFTIYLLLSQLAGYRSLYGQLDSRYHQKLLNLSSVVDCTVSPFNTCNK